MNAKICKSLRTRVLLLYNGLIVAAVNAYLKFAVKLDVTQELGLLNGGQILKHVIVKHISPARERVNVYISGVE